jgi:hypothetical protein
MDDSLGQGSSEMSVVENAVGDSAASGRKIEQFLKPVAVLLARVFVGAGAFFIACDGSFAEIGLTSDRGY